MSIENDDIIRTPKAVYEVLGNIAPTCHVDLVESDDSVKIRFTAGVMSTTEPSYEPPFSTFNSELMFDFVDGVIAEDDQKVCQVAEKIYDYELSVKHNDRIRGPLSKSESNVEHCFFSDGVSFAELLTRFDLEDVVLLNPSKGSLKRFVERQLSVPKVVMLPKTKVKHRRDIKEMCAEYDLEYSEKTSKELSDDNLYYLSFRGSLGKILDLKYYVGFEPNPLQLAMRGKVQEMIRGRRYDEYVYYRYTDERRLRYYWVDAGYNLYPSDYLFSKYERKREFRYNQPLMHDLYSSVDIYDKPMKVIKASIVPYNCRFIVGNYNHDNKGIYNDDGYIVEVGNRSWSTRVLHEDIRQYDDVGRGFQVASYAISLYGSAIIFLGKKRFLKQCDVEMCRYIIAYKQGRPLRVCPRLLRTLDIEDIVSKGSAYYYDVDDPNDADAVVVQKAGGSYECRHAKYADVAYQELPSDISQLYGSETYCTTTYQTIVGVKTLYVRQEDDGLMDGMDDTTDYL